MKPTSSFIFQVGLVTASIFDTILPTTKGTITSDPWQCATHTFQSFFDVPKPTGALLDALMDHGDAIQKGCKSTLTDAMGKPACTPPPQSDWCAFTKSAPSSLLTVCSSYGGTDSSWWAEHSSEAVEYAEYCPNQWFRAMTSLPYGAVWLNDTIAFASCYAAAHAADKPSESTVSTTTVDLTSTYTGTGAAASATESVNIVGGKQDDRGVRVARIELAGAAINALLS
ncbi:hypothetical protein FVEN_g7795 [Fusarium venenatum]|uniref:DUF7735 domain-containing protein n=1 Tax=Fusarium venenatum TaxID=56646 RepID=A0A2L2TD94_9HYPO|nr:uncharacterized protein FVRRES_08006 [Fusarium venenatum]KAG8354284.1 hypothetical protein FVEN_g7795 [Fusarium venenatum]KAH6964794.1 hypothetical protein EDB82DRAFT_560547 [Fusarium venenatum]CEI67929.1 unnamed protein product [Fusarium venenatum]